MPEKQPFPFEPASFVPFRDPEVLNRVRNIKREDLEKHPNPDFHIRIVPDSMLRFIHFSDYVARLIETRDNNEPCVTIMGNPLPAYRELAHMINRLGVDCSHLHVFAMDEWADQDGRIAPTSYPQSFMRALWMHFWDNLDPNLRPPGRQILGPTNENIDDYGKMLADFGGATACYSGSGWAGHIAFIDPGAPELDAPLEEWKQLSARVVTLHPLTIAQNSLHASFGRSGDIAAVPPKAATIGPAEVVGAKYRMDFNGLSIAGSNVSWQRMTTRLIAHGPVTPSVPTSILQTLPTDFYITETAAMDIEPDWTAGY